MLQFLWYEPYSIESSVKIGTPENQLRPVAGVPTTWALPNLTNAGDLAEWLGISCGELEWFADCSQRISRLPKGPLHHYSYR